ncbi:unnamed protein product [Paramecium octaurelia]|uniref:Transmembrane protein n=1 Tax=Paramecium octaurelia TaxID=43137 RepID=A0A8S1Y3T4_PAROT|nr:unnamed protein product [Paramecium octaurelia]
MVFYCPQRKPKLNLQLISEILNSQNKGKTEIVFHSPKSVKYLHSFFIHQYRYGTCIVFSFTNIGAVPARPLRPEYESLSVYGMLKQDNKKPDQMVILEQLIQFATLLIVLHQYLVAQISLSVYGMLRQDNKKSNQMAIQIMQEQFVTLLIVLNQHLVVLISLFVSGMQNHQRRYFNQIVVIKICLPSLTYLFRIAPYCKMLILIVQYLEFARILCSKHQEHLFYKHNSLMIMVKIQTFVQIKGQLLLRRLQAKVNLNIHQKHYNYNYIILLKLF